MKVLEIRRCQHGHYAIVAGESDGVSVRLSSTKCCGQWPTEIASFRLDYHSAREMVLIGRKVVREELRKMKEKRVAEASEASALSPLGLHNEHCSCPSCTGVPY